MSSTTPSNLPTVSLEQLQAAADKLERLMYDDYAAAVRQAVALIAHEHPDWYAANKLRRES